ncbi:K+-transporting ATPase, F subunit [Clostridium perfringens]|nr:Not available [Clostridium perfringens]EGT4138785.1 potassium-transporting ATPase subunit F [Clostridium perfringens]PVE16795.1 K+-transporting ATPase, F subunit [Clostridium perfringens]PWX06610.1 K+-transporting ATPase, F subunit [Clostridium perfringens]PWX24716.1 K+-transporting ATPase, F subunit [Clostridium perfringens]
MDLILIITGLTFLILFIYLWYILLRGEKNE